MIDEIFQNDPRFDNIKNNIVGKFEQYLNIAKTKQFKIEILDVVVMKLMEQIKYTINKSHTEKQIEDVTESFTPVSSYSTAVQNQQQNLKFIDSLLLAIQQIRTKIPSSVKELESDKFEQYRFGTGYDNLQYIYLDPEERLSTDEFTKSAAEEYQKYIRKYVVSDDIWNALDQEL